MKYFLAILSLLVVGGCGSATSVPAASPSASASADSSRPFLNDWDLDAKHDVISETDSLHLVKINSPTPGVISAEIKSDPAIFVWQQSAGDFVVQGLLRSAGVASNPVSTLVRWRIGKSIHEGHIAEGKFNNVVDIANFSTLSSSESWTGSLAVATDTDHGQVAIEIPIDTPNTRIFLTKCTADLARFNAEKAIKETEARATAKAAAAAARERAVLEEKGKSAFSNVIDTFWPKCGEYHVLKNLRGDQAVAQVRALVVQFTGNHPLTALSEKMAMNGRATMGRALLNSGDGLSRRSAML
jgi:hypothetical protein